MANEFLTCDLRPARTDNVSSIKQERKICHITVDVEEDLGTKVFKKEFSGVINGLPLVLDILNSLKIKATFFVTGEVALKFPDIIKEIHRNHEVASHGLYHIKINRLDAHTIRKHLHQSIEILQRVVSRRPIGYRAVGNVMNNYLMGLLEEGGFLYDSSVLPNYPLFKKYEGFRGYAPSHPYHPNHIDYKKIGSRKILEMPISTIPVIKFPWVGTWLRIWGTKLYKMSVQCFMPNYLLLALHSWDFIDIKGKTLYSRNSGKNFLNIFEDLVLFLIEKEYDFKTLSDGSKLYE